MWCTVRSETNIPDSMLLVSLNQPRAFCWLVNSWHPENMNVENKLVWSEQRQARARKCQGSFKNFRGLYSEGFSRNMTLKKPDSALKLGTFGELFQCLEAFRITLTLREALCGKCGQEFKQSKQMRQRPHTLDGTCTLPELGCGVPIVACMPNSARPTYGQNKKQ